MPFLLKLLTDNDLNETGMSFFLRLLSNKYIWKGIEYFATKILHILLSYKGPQSFEAGVKIAQIVEELHHKYVALRDIYTDYEDDSYSTILKKIPFEIYVGVPF
jgi:hypothetical protein